MRIPLRRAPRHDPAEGGREPDPVLRLARATPPPIPSVESLEREILDHAARIARLRFVRSRLAATFLARKSWSPLGFVRIGDYTRERLGLAARTLQQEAQVAQALERLPRTTATFLESRLSWTQVRLITSVARASDERTWIDSALSSDTRALAERVRAHAPTSHSATDSSEDEPTTKFSVRISRRARRYWRAACEMAERNAGCRL